MTTLQIDNTVHDSEQWREAFDRYEQARAQHRVRSYTIRRHHGEPNRVRIDLEFDSVADADAFKVVLAKIWSTPVSQAQLAGHSEPVVLDDVDRRTLRAEDASTAL